MAEPEKPGIVQKANEYFSNRVKLSAVFAAGAIFAFALLNDLGANLSQFTTNSGVGFFTVLGGWWAKE